MVDYALRGGWARSIDLDIGKVLGAEDKGAAGGNKEGIRIGWG